MSIAEIALRTIGVAQLLLLAWLMLRARRRVVAARTGAAFSLSLAAFLVTSAPPAAAGLGWFIYPLTALCAMHPVLFWLFCWAVFADKSKLTRAHGVMLGAVALAGLSFEALSPASSDGLSAMLWQVGGTALALGSIGFAMMAPITVFLDRKTDLDPRRRQIRTVFVPIVAGYLCVTVVVRLGGTWSGAPTPHALVLANLGVINAVVAIALSSFVELRWVNWLDLTSPLSSESALSRVERSVLEQLNRRLVPERLFAREGLTVSALAKLLHTQEHIMRRVINRGLGFRNFNEFLHTHRLREAAQRLLDPAERRIPVLTIALESGYASIGPFNRAFKERFGVTPTAYRRSRSSDDNGTEAVALSGMPDPTAR